MARAESGMDISFGRWILPAGGLTQGLGVACASPCKAQNWWFVKVVGMKKP